MQQCLFFGSWFILFFGLIHRLSLWNIHCFLRKNQTVNQILMSLRVMVKVLASQLCLTLWNPMGCRLPGSSDHGILQAKILEWVAMLSSRGSSQPRDWTHIFYMSFIGWQILCHLRHQESPMSLNHTQVNNKNWWVKWRMCETIILALIEQGIRTVFICKIDIKLSLFQRRSLARTFKYFSKMIQISDYDLIWNPFSCVTPSTEKLFHLFYSWISYFISDNFRAKVFRVCKYHPVRIFIS